MPAKPSYEELEQKIKELENDVKYRYIFENIQDIYYEASPDGKILEVSPSVEKLSGYRREGVIGKSLYELYVNPAERDEVFKELLRTGEVNDYEVLLRDVNGEKACCAVTARLIRDKSGNPEKIIGSLRNITKRKRMESVLRESEAQMTAILEASIDRIRYVDKDMKVLWANKAAASGLEKMSAEELKGRTCYEVFIGRHTPCEGCPTVKAMETGQIQRAVMRQARVKGIDGESYWDAYCVPIRNNAGEVQSYLQVSRNITDRKEAEEEIHRLSQELIRAQENERRRISRELHDRVAQDLSTAKILADRILLSHKEARPTEVRREISNISRAIQGVIHAVRNLAYDLRPPVLDDMGLVQTIFQYCEEFSERTGLNIEFSSAGLESAELDSDTEINVYRLIQEGLNNVQKHAEARRVMVKLVRAFPNIILRIEDDGKGFDVHARRTGSPNEKRMGLQSMEERVNLLQGKMAIQSRPMQGTKIIIRIPSREAKSDS